MLSKAAIGWLDGSAITQHFSGTAHYDLHSVGLVQPPPSGRSTALRIGATVPYVMVEARQRVDQFDANIPGEGVIVYRVQTPDPLGHALSGIAPVELLTTTALQVGQAFAPGPHMNVHVTKALPGGFSISVELPLPGNNAIGFITSYESERLNPDKPAGANNPLLQSIEIDSMPAFSFNASGGPIYAAVVKKAQDTHRKVEIRYTPEGPSSGKLLGVTLA